MSYKEEIEKKFHIQEYDLYPDISKAHLRLELSNICNDKCPFCPNSKIQRKRVSIEKDLAFRIIKETGELGVKKAGLFMNGEPFVTKNLDEYVAYCKKCGIDYVFITTNGGLATKETLKAVLDAGLDSIKFSINAGSKESYKKIHCQDDYDKVIENLKFVYEYRKSSGLKFNILSSFVMTKYTMAEIEDHRKNVEPYVDDLVFFEAQSFGGQMIDEVNELRAVSNDDKLKTFAPNAVGPCTLLFNSINVTAEGYLTLCCSEAFNYLVIEDLNEMSLKDAWYSDKMVEMRKKHIENDLEGTQCYKCRIGKICEVKPLNEKLYISSLKN